MRLFRRLRPRYSISAVIAGLCLGLSQSGQVKNYLDKFVPDVSSCFSFNSSSSSPSAGQANVSSYGLPLEKMVKGKFGDGEVISHTGYSLFYNYDNNTPSWVTWELTADEVNSSSADRSSSDFTPDTSLPSRYQVTKFDYSHSGYDRGHMCPAADMKWSSDAMEDCFLMSNMCPQTPELNEHWWEHLEKACRRWAVQEKSIIICCGPIYNPSHSNFIGKDHKVRVPDGFFKAVLTIQPNYIRTIAFLYSNTSKRQTMEDAVMPVNNLESLTGYDFFSFLDDDVEEKVESSASLSQWN